jgi:hypothetical protein
MDIGNGALKELERQIVTGVQHRPPTRRADYAIGPVVAIEFHSSSDSPKSSRMHHRDYNQSMQVSKVFLDQKTQRILTAGRGGKDAAWTALSSEATLLSEGRQY